uniref:alpha-N-acetylgalactosaminide alpha-2,6-sialyltransferase n=1 Tax=Leptobrachium leishanense TaxID=445787 RepID=A0A8C5MPG7_9ANUR
RPVSPQLYSITVMLPLLFLLRPAWLNQYLCPISVKIKASNSPWLKEIFLPQITIFMDNRHFSYKEWERLKHFIPPFGWMTLNYTGQSYSNTKLHAPRCVSCAVVGNGGILNGSRLGKEINEHDYVFRLNGAVTKGYERDVGNRTSFYGFTASTVISSLHYLRTEGFPNIPISAVKKPPRYIFGSSFNLNKLLVAHPDFTRYVKDRYLRSKTLKSKYWAIYRPTTGALVLLTALHLCDTVSAYGFMTEDYKSYSNHYYDKYKKEMILYANHDFLLEKNLWRYLHQENIMKLYQRT